MANSWQHSLEHLLQAIIERVCANDSSIVRKEDNATALASKLLRQVPVFAHDECASVVALRLPKHNLRVLLLALTKEATDHGDLVLADHQLQLIFQELDHTLFKQTTMSIIILSTYLHDEVLECRSVLGRLARIALLQLLQS